VFVNNFLLPIFPDWVYMLRNTYFRKLDLWT